MRTRFNRFAILPKLCHNCKLYIWMEPYRKAEIENSFGNNLFKSTICKRCIDRYLPKEG